MNFDDGAQDALSKMARAHQRGTGCHITADEIKSLSLTTIGELWAQDDPRLEVIDGWHNVACHRPKYDKTPNSFGVPVMMRLSAGLEMDGFYGCRVTDKPSFYLHGSEQPGVTHWKHRKESAWGSPVKNVESFPDTTYRGT